jgi:hypothetical protein
MESIQQDYSFGYFMMYENMKIRNLVGELVIDGSF